MEHSFSSIQLRWLTEGRPDHALLLAEEGDVGGQALPIDPLLGTARLEIIHLPHGSTLTRGTHHLLPAAAGRMVPLGEFSVDYGGATFVVQTQRGGQCCHHESMPESTQVFEAGRDLFCHLRQRRFIPMVGGSVDSTMVSLCMKVTSLKAYLGAAEAGAMLDLLGIPDPQSQRVHAMPRTLAALLHQAMNAPALGSARKLLAQAAILKYLSQLSDHLGQSGSGQAPQPRHAERTRALHDFLLTVEGKAPGLEDLAQRFECSARGLNADFTAKYGQSIVAFLTDLRLEQARTVILETDTPLKAIAARLGYAHVGHFSLAFKRRFGCAPGQLRRAAS